MIDICNLIFMAIINFGLVMKFNITFQILICERASILFITQPILKIFVVPDFDWKTQKKTPGN